MDPFGPSDIFGGADIGIDGVAILVIMFVVAVLLIHAIGSLFRS